MKTEDKTKEQLNKELTEMRQRVAELEALAAERKSSDFELRLYARIAQNQRLAYALADENLVIVAHNDRLKRWIRGEADVLVGQ